MWKSINKNIIKPLIWKSRVQWIDFYKIALFTCLTKLLVQSFFLLQWHVFKVYYFLTLTLRHWWKETRSLYKVSSFSINFAWKHVILAQSCLLSHWKCDKCLMKTTPHSLVSDNSYHTVLLWSKQTLKRSSKHALHHRTL